MKRCELNRWADRPNLDLYETVHSKKSRAFGLRLLGRGFAFHGHQSYFQRALEISAVHVVLVSTRVYVPASFYFTDWITDRRCKNFVLQFNLKRGGRHHRSLSCTYLSRPYSRGL